SCKRDQRLRSRVSSKLRSSKVIVYHRLIFEKFLTLLKIEIARRFLANPGKNGSRNEPAVIQLRFARVGLLQHNKAYKFRMISRHITAEGNDILSLFVTAFWIDFL